MIFPAAPKQGKQIEALTVVVRKQREEKALRVADRYLDEWFRHEAIQGRPLPTLSAEARAIALRLIATGEYAGDAARLALEETRNVTYRPPLK